MLDIALSALGQALSLSHLGFLGLGVLVGLMVGILPGLGGIAGMSILLPFLYGMETTAALGMLIGMVAVIPTGDTFTSVLMGIPGSSASQATVLDGFPLAKRGEAARALSAAFTSSLLGGVVGALVLSVAIVLARPLVLSFSSAELFMLTVFGLSMVAVLSGRSLVKGIGAAGFGLVLGTVGTAPATGEPRMVMGIDYLYDGVPLVVVAMGLFALPEIIDLLRRGSSISDRAVLGGGWKRGLRDVLNHPWLVARCAALGCMIGALPGLGGSVVDWIAYSHVVQTSRDRSQFGNGDIRGVIAPESANNACQGGALIPTLLFGVPGSGSMAVFLGGMVLLGIQPGVTMVESRLDVTYSIIWSLALANILGAALCVVLARYIARLTSVRFAYLAPFMVMITLFAAYQATRSIADLVALIAMGAVGLYMRRFGWPRPALLIGFVLAPGAENYLYQAVQFYDWGWVTRPGVLIIGAITLVSLFLGLRSGAVIESEGTASAEAQHTRGWQIGFASLLLAVGAYCAADALNLSFLARIFPLAAGGITLIAVAIVAGQIRQGSAKVLHDDDAAPRSAGTFRAETYLMLFGLVTVGIWLIGFLPAMAIFFPLFLVYIGGASWTRSLIMAASAIGFLAVLTWAMTLRLPHGIVWNFLS
jgi:putative tricarboxylic transport membrane protein